MTELEQMNERINYLEGIVAGMMKSNQYTLWKDVVFNKNIEIKDGVNIALKATTGTKIGTATPSGQKLGFFNATPVVQQAAITAPTGGTTIDSQARTAINSIRTELTALGLTA